jgi:hypothetical protein
MINRQKLDWIIEKYKNRSDSPSDGVMFFLAAFETYRQAVTITDFSSLSENDRKRKQFENNLLGHNLIVNAVTAVEILLKRIIIDGKNWQETGFQKLLNNDIKLSDAFHLFNRENITREYVVAHSNSLESIESIDRVFSLLTGDEFLNEVGQVLIPQMISGRVPMAIDNSIPDWRNTLAKMYSIRHLYIHEAQLTELTFENGSDYFFEVITIMDAINGYFGRRGDA